MEFKRIEPKFAEEISKAQESKGQDPEIQSAYDARDSWQVIDQVSTFELNSFGTAIGSEEVQPGGNNVDVTPNQEFSDLFQRFVEAVSDYTRSNSDLNPTNTENPAANEIFKIVDDPFRHKP